MGSGGVRSTRRRLRICKPFLALGRHMHPMLPSVPEKQSLDEGKKLVSYNGQSSSGIALAHPSFVETEAGFQPRNTRPHDGLPGVRPHQLEQHGRQRGLQQDGLGSGAVRRHTLGRVSNTRARRSDRGFSHPALGATETKDTTRRGRCHCRALLATVLSHHRLVERGGLDDRLFVQRSLPKNDTTANVAGDIGIILLTFQAKSKSY